MASAELTLAPTMAQSTNTRDFVSPQTSLTSAELFQKHQMGYSRTYFLRHESQDRQTLIPLSASDCSSYTLKSNLTSGFRHRKPHMIIRREQDGRNNSVVSAKSQQSQRRGSIFSMAKEQGENDLAEVRFEMRGTDTDILYKENSFTQTLKSQNSSNQTYACPIDGREYWWRPLGPSRTVLELVNGEEQRVALFMHASEDTLSTGMGASRTASLGVMRDVGELYILDDIKGGTRAQEEVLCSAMAVVERAKRIRQQR